MKHKTKILYTLVLLLPFVAHATNGKLATNSAGEYEVADYADLKVVGTGSYSLSASYRLTADINATTSLTENNGAGFLPIGSDANRFTGKFYGAGHEIQGLYINPTGGWGSLFGSIDNGGLVDGIRIVGGHSEGLISGCLAGKNYGIITSSFTSCTAVAQTIVGGVVGQNFGTITGSFASGSTFAGSVDGSAGGLVGVNNGTITDSYATGSASGARYTGGVAGVNLGDITKTFATGLAITGWAGGLVGHNEGSVTNSYWDVTTTQQDIACNETSPVVCTATGLTSDQMLQSTSFVDLDFSSTWVQYNSHTNPLLRSFLKPLMVTAKDTTKVYDGVAFSGGNGVQYSPSDANTSLIQGSLSFSGTSQGAADAGEYTILTDSALWSTQFGYLIGYSANKGTLKISARPITITGVTANNKEYDGTMSATLNGGKFVDTIVGDALILTKGTGVFDSKNVGTSKNIIASGYTIGGADAGNYVLSAQPAGIKANITPYPITITADAKSIQQGKPDVPLTYKAIDLLGDDEFTGELTREKGSAAGTYKILLGTLSAGDNYKITYKGANYVITKTVSIDPVVPFVAFTGRTQAHIFNLQGVQVWNGMVEVNGGKVVMPNIGAGRWVVKYP